MLDLIYDRTAEDVASPNVPLAGDPRVNSASSVLLFDRGAGASPRGAFLAQGGKRYSFTVYRHIPQTVYIYHIDAGGGLETADEFGSVAGVSRFDFEPETDQYIRIELTDFNDVSTAEQAAEVEIYLANDKAYYRHTDLNRVQAAVAYLRGVYHAYGYDLVKGYTLPVWQENDVPRREQGAAYLGAVRALDGWVPIPGKPVLPQTVERMDYNGANAIEKFLAMTEDTLERISLAWFYCDEVYSGEVDV